MIILTNEEKINILNQHKRNVSMSKYNAEISLLSENSVTEPNAAVVADLNNQIIDFNKKLSAIEAEIESLS